MLLLLFCRCRAAALLLLVQAPAQHCKLALGQGAEGKADQLTLQLLAAGHCMTATTMYSENLQNVQVKIAGYSAQGASPRGGGEG
jgi:hypothetical protein